MNRAVGLSILISCAAGFFGAELAARSIPLREKLGQIAGRGNLLALVGGQGIYQADVDRALRESDYANEIERTDAAEVERRAALTRLIANAMARSRASSERISGAELKHEIDLLAFQFPSARVWQQSLASSRLSVRALSIWMNSDLRARRWISARIARALDVNEEECRRFYDSHSEDFFVPERTHAGHIFLAAPPETPPEVVATKRKAIEMLSVRLAAGEDFAALAAQNSEDEATKLNGGDLGYFSTVRMPPDFVSTAAKLRPGEVSRPVQTRLGFHIIRLIDIQPARERSFEEARADIAMELANERRAQALTKLISDLGSGADYLRSF